MIAKAKVKSKSEMEFYKIEVIFKACPTQSATN